MSAYRVMLVQFGDTSTKELQYDVDAFDAEEACQVAELKAEADGIDACASQALLVRRQLQCA